MISHDCLSLLLRNIYVKTTNAFYKAVITIISKEKYSICCRLFIWLDWCCTKQIYRNNIISQSSIPLFLINMNHLQWRIYMVKFWTSAPPSRSNVLHSHTVFCEIGWRLFSLELASPIWEILDGPRIYVN